MTSLNLRATRTSLLGTLAFAALLFLPAWSLAYWQAWVFLAVFAGASGGITAYLALRDPELLERRMRAGPTAETAPQQKIAIFFVMAGFVALLVVPGFDHRFGWSPVPAFVSIVGDLLVGLGFLFIFFVIRENSYAASTIQVAKDQKVIETGPYAIVRHPMYASALFLLVGTPLALGSWWSLAIPVLIAPALIWRIVDEERFLSTNLPGYDAYMKKVRTRLIPGLI